MAGFMPGIVFRGIQGTDYSAVQKELDRRLEIFRIEKQAEMSKAEMELRKDLEGKRLALDKESLETRKQEGIRATDVELKKIQESKEQSQANREASMEETKYREESARARQAEEISAKERQSREEREYAEKVRAQERESKDRESMMEGLAAELEASGIADPAAIRAHAMARGANPVEAEKMIAAVRGRILARTKYDAEVEGIKIANETGKLSKQQAELKLREAAAEHFLATDPSPIAKEGRNAMMELNGVKQELDSIKQEMAVIQDQFHAAVQMNDPATMNRLQAAMNARAMDHSRLSQYASELQNRYAMIRSQVLGAIGTGQTPTTTDELPSASKRPARGYGGAELPRVDYQKRK